jgi:HEAT repeat protein
MLDSPRIEIRSAAATALGDLGSPGAVPALRRLLDDQHLLPRMAAVGALLKLGDPAGMSQAYQWFQAEAGDIRLRAAEVTAVNPDANWQSHVRQLLQDPDPMVRIGAARLLGKHDPGAAMWALQPLTSDENLAIREEAQRVLPEAIGGDFAELRRYLRAADADTRVRAALRIVELTR